MSKKKAKNGVINIAALDELIAQHGHAPEAILGERGLLALLTKALVERVLGAELTHHLKTGHGPLEEAVAGPEGAVQAAANCRNGFSPKTVLGDIQALLAEQYRIEVSRWPPQMIRWPQQMIRWPQRVIRWPPQTEHWLRRRCVRHRGFAG